MISTTAGTNHRLDIAIFQQKAPVIVTFDGHGRVMDAVGELLYYAETESQLIEFLGYLIVGWQEHSNTLAEVQMPSGRYADVQLLSEGALRHVILFDVTASTLDRREILQTSHEVALTERQRRTALESNVGLSERTNSPGSQSADGHREDAIELLSWDIRARIDEIREHARFLSEKESETSSAAHSIASLKRASMHLYALTSACIVELHGAKPSIAAERDPIAAREVVSDLQRGFTAGPRLQSVYFDSAMRLARSDAMFLDCTKAYQLLVCAICSLLDVSGRSLEIRSDVNGKRFTMDIRSDSETNEGNNIDAHYDGVLHALLMDSRYRASQSLAALLGGKISSTKHACGDVLARITLPVFFSPFGIRAEDTAEPRDNLTVLVAIDESALRERVLRHLATLGVSAQVCADVESIERKSTCSDVSLIVLGGSFAGASGVGTGYRIQARGIHRRMLLLRPRLGLGSSAWLLQGRRTVISPDADDDSLLVAMEEALQP